MQPYFEYLDELRDSGVTNMFGAEIYLETEFGVDRYEAKRILLAWMIRNSFVKKYEMKTFDLNGAALDWAVAKCEGIDHDTAILNIKYGDDNDWFLAFSTDWAQGGPIIEEHGIHLEWSESHLHWLAYSWDRFSNESHHCALGDTALVAAMRCYVASKLGDEVEIPQELK